MSQFFVEQMQNFTSRIYLHQLCASATLRTFFWFGAAFALVGCGPYSFSGSASTHIKTIAVPVFEDRTAEFGVKERLSTAIVEEFTRDNTLKIADRRVADSVLLGALLSVQESAGVYNQQESVQEVRVTVTVQLKYEDVKKRKTLWETQLSQFGSYSPSSASSSRQAAIDEAIQKIANEVRNKTVSDW
ncbi:MAG: hypothetical protein ALAOOOJD_01984 [bacterium]|nr:hypothetical protein [bacterium]